MRTISGLALIALGAILAFAVRAHPHWLNIQIAGWILMLVGVAGIVIPKRTYGQIRRRLVRRVVLRRTPGGTTVVIPVPNSPLHIAGAEEQRKIVRETGGVPAEEVIDQYLEE